MPKALTFVRAFSYPSICLISMTNAVITVTMIVPLDFMSPPRSVLMEPS